MPDDRDADVDPASDREDLFGRAPASDADDPAAHPDEPGQPRSEAVPPVPSGNGRGVDDVPDAPLFPSTEADRPDPATSEPASSGEAADADAADAAAPPDRAAPPDDAHDPAVVSAASSEASADDRGKSRSSSGGSTSSFLRELPVLLLVALLLAFLLRTFVLQVFFIPSGSMEPTLQVDDRMVVEKITYLFREPVRGEIVVFEGESFGVIDPDATAGERIVRGFGQFLGVVPASARDYVKRVIGLPGDEIVIDAGQVFVNGQALDEPYVVFPDPSDFGPVTVPDDHLFFLGDNRPNSADSRRGLGFVPTDAVVGRSAVIIWPFDNAGRLTGVEHELDDTTRRLDDTTTGDEAPDGTSAEADDEAA
jgi:signal peptidase I